MDIVKDADEVMHLVREEMHGWDMQLLANRIGMSAGAMRRIRSGRTKWPRDTTLFALIHTFGWQIRIERRTA